jgi:DHA1 family tetracycline resistance protein-like MFS transporter
MAAPDPPTEQGVDHLGSRPVLVVVFATILVDFVGFSVLIPVLPLYAERLGASPFEVGLILTLYALAQLAFLPAWGWVSDRIGRRPVILVSLLGTALSFLLLSIADTIGVIYAARILSGTFAASIGTAQAVVTDVTSPSQRARGMGMIGAAFGVGMIVGPMVGGVLAVYGEKLPFYAIALLATANLVLAWLRLPETRPREGGRWVLSEFARTLIPTPLRLIASTHDKRIALYLYLFFHLFTAFAVLEGMVTLYLGEKYGASELDVAEIFAWIGFVLAISQGYLLPRLVSQLGEVRLVSLGLVVMGAGMALVAVASSLSWFFAIGTLIAFGNAVTFPSFTSLFSKACGQAKAGELLARSQSMATTGRIVGPMGAGWAMENLGLSTPFWIASGMMITALMIFVAARRTLLET